MPSFKSISGALGATALLTLSAVAFASTEVSLELLPAQSYFRIGATNYAIAGGALVGEVDAPGAGGTCSFTVDAAKSNALFQPTRIRRFPPVYAQMQLCGDIKGTVGSTASGKATMDVPNARVRVKISGTMNCELPCTTMNLTSDGNADARDYDVRTGTVTLVDEDFEISNSTCGSMIDSFMELPSGRGNNRAALSLKIEGAAPTCQR